MTNFDKWRAYTNGLSSPQNYINWTWLYTINASLQRRVWLGPKHQPCFPNMYVILVGAPGIGKGLAIREVSEMLKHWKLETTLITKDDSLTPEQRVQKDTIAELDLKAATDSEFQGKSKGADIIKPLLIPIAADATTYEALVKAVADSYRRKDYIETNSEGKQVQRIYGHSSLCFSLQELASLMRKRTDDTVNYMLGLYDCPEDYEYITKTQGKDRVRRGCLNLLAGTTPSFMQSTFDEKLMDEGFASRTFYIYAQRNRKNQMWIPPLTEEQLSHKQDLLNHVKKLTTLYGAIYISPETRDFLQTWWDESEKNKHTRANKSLKLIPYYSRKNIHTMKVAMAIHFSESTEMEIPLSAFQKAIEFLADEEKNMHLAITLEGNNPLSKVSKKILELLATGKKNFVDLHVETFALAKKAELEEALSFLTDTGAVSVSIETDEDKTTQYWRVKE